MLLDLWLHTVFQDAGVPGSALGPVVYYRNEGSLPLVSCTMLAKRWGVSKASVHRVLKKFEQLSLVAVHHYPGKRSGFIHLPFLTQQVADKPGMPAMELEEMVRGLTAALEAMAQTETDLRYSEGTLN